MVITLVYEYFLTEKMGNQYFYANKEQNQTTQQARLEPLGDGTAEANTQPITHQAE